MALTVAKLDPNADTVFGNKVIKVRDVTFDSSYVTGGESLVPEDVGLTHFDAVLPGTGFDTTNSLAVVVAYDYVDETLVAFGDNAAVGLGEFTQIASTDNLSAVTSRVVFIGH